MIVNAVLVYCFQCQGSFSFIKTSRKNAAYRVKVEKDLVPPALALQPIVQRDGLVIIRAGMTPVPFATFPRYPHEPT